MSKRFYTEEATLAKHPVNGVVGPDEWIDIFTEAGYCQETWLQLGSAFLRRLGEHSQLGRGQDAREPLPGY